MGISFHQINYSELKEKSFVEAASNLVQLKSFYFNNIFYNVYTVKKDQLNNLGSGKNKTALHIF